MKKHIILLTALITAFSILTGCGLVELLPDMTVARELPHLMVRSAEVAMHPRDPEFERCYQTQENLTDLLNLLREISTGDAPEEEPKVGDGQTYYTVTVTYASGRTREYILLGHRYLKVGDEPWCELEKEDAMRFNQFLRDHQSDDGSYVPPTTEPPAETTLPTETGTAPTAES